MSKKYDFELELGPEEANWFQETGVSPDFPEKLKRQLLSRQSQWLIDSKKNHPSLNLRTISMRLRSSTFGLAMSVIFVLALISGAVYGAGLYFGYIPGLGMVDQEEPFRVLEEPATMEQDGIQLKVVSVFSATDKLSIVYSTKGIPADIFEQRVPATITPENNRCGAEVWLELPDGRKSQAFAYGSIGYGEEQDYQKLAFFDPIEQDINRFSFHMDCIEGTYPGWAPENWVVPVKLAKLSETIDPYPVIKMSTGGGEPQPHSIQITELIPLGEKFIILGKYYPQNNGVSSVHLSDIAFTDAAGIRHSFNVAGDLGMLSSGTPGDFAYIVNAGLKDFPMEMSIGIIEYYVNGDAAYTVDLAKIPPDSKEYPVNQTLNIGDARLIIETIRNSGTGLTLTMTGIDQLLAYVSVSDPAGLITKTRNISLHNRVVLELETPTIAAQDKIDLLFGGASVEPAVPVTKKIELVDQK